MTQQHYGYPQLPQHVGPWFFADQIAHLEIAVNEVPVKVEHIPRPLPAFHETLAGRALEYMQGKTEYIYYRELADHLDATNKSANKSVNTLRRMGWKFDTKQSKGVMMVKLVGKREVSDILE
jgi:biotin operon repressor